MSENFNKSKEEVALELFQIILSGTVKSADAQKLVRDKIDLDTSSLEAKYNWYLKLFENCLKTVKDEDKSK